MKMITNKHIKQMRIAGMKIIMRKGESNLEELRR